MSDAKERLLVAIDAIPSCDPWAKRVEAVVEEAYAAGKSAAYHHLPSPLCSCPVCVTERLAQQAATPQLFRFYASYTFTCLDCQLEIRADANTPGDAAVLDLDKLFLSEPCAHRRFRIET